MSNDHIFNSNMAFTKANGGGKIQLAISPKPPTVEEIEAFQERNKCGTYQARFNAAGECEAIMWDRPFDQDMFTRWVQNR